MPSLELAADSETRSKARTVSQLLDGAFGFFVWATHFLVIYIATALACVLGLGTATRDYRISFLAALAIVTAAAAAVVVLHAVRRYRQQRDIPQQRFRMSVTIGCDSIATVAIVWQLFPTLLVPVCA
jgi:hypothetical protein